MANSSVDPYRNAIDSRVMKTGEMKFIAVASAGCRYSSAMMKSTEETTTLTARNN